MSKDILIKSSVKFREINPYTLLFMQALLTCCDEFDYAYVITSANDSTHSDNSYHYKNCAWDVRLNDLEPFRWYTLQNRLKQLLPEYFDILIENTDSQYNVHLHVEADLNKAEAYDG